MPMRVMSGVSISQAHALGRAQGWLCTVGNIGKPSRRRVGLRDVASAPLRSRAGLRRCAPAMRRRCRRPMPAAPTWRSALAAPSRSCCAMGRCPRAAEAMFTADPAGGRRDRMAVSDVSGLAAGKPRAPSMPCPAPARAWRAFRWIMARGRGCPARRAAQRSSSSARGGAPRSVASNPSRSFAIRSSTSRRASGPASCSPLQIMISIRMGARSRPFWVNA